MKDHPKKPPSEAPPEERDSLGNTPENKEFSGESLSEGSESPIQGPQSRRQFLLSTIVQCIRGVITQMVGAQMVQLSLRHFQRLIYDYRHFGGNRITVPAKRGKPHNAMQEETVKEIVRLAEAKYRDVPPLQMTEYLWEYHQIKISKEGLRKLLMSHGLWEGRKAKVVHRRARERRSCFGELLQIDSSIHHWLGEDIPKFWLIICIDDATGIIFGRFFETDSTETNMAILKAYCERYGLPLALYSDRAGHFTVNLSAGKPAANGKEQPLTQIQRALKELGINQILARSPAAKGRVERVFRTLQDRLIVWLRVNNIKTIDEANEGLREIFLERFNKRFAIEPKSGMNAHRPTCSADLEAIFSVQETRMVRNDDTIKLDGKRYQLDLRASDPKLKGKQVVVERRLNGLMAIRHGKIYYKHHLIIE